MSTPNSSIPSSLRTQLITWFIVLAISPLFLVTLFSYFQMQKSITQTVTHDLVRSVKNNEQFIKNWFYYRKVDLNHQANIDTNAWLLSELTKNHELSGKTLYEFVRSYEWQKIVTGVHDNLMNTYHHYDFIYDIFLIDNDGSVLYTLAKEDDFGSNIFSGYLNDTNFSVAVKETVKTGKSLISDFERYSPSGDAISAFITAPLMDGDGERIGVIAIQLRLERVMALLDNQNKQHFSYFMVGTDGYLRSPIDSDMDSVLSAKVETPLIENFIQLDRVLSDDELPDEDIELGVEKYINDSGRLVLGYASLIKVWNLEWILVSEVDYDIAFSALHWLRNLLMLLLLGTMLTVIIFSFAVSRKITQPLMQLAGFMRSAQKGRFNKSISIDANNEIGYLADAFNHMLITRIDYEKELKLRNTEVKKVLSDLEEQRFALSHHAIVSITNIRGDIQYVNDKFIEISGYAQDQLMGQNHRMLNSGVHNVDFFREMYLTISQGGVWQGDICNKNHSGEEYWVNSTIAPFKDVDGKIKSYIALRTDITELKNNQRDLLIERDKAEMASQAKSEFLACMSHEIRTPMNGVIGMLGLLLKTPLNKDQKRKADVAESSALSLLAIINDILDFSKIDAGKMDIEHIDFNLIKLLSDVADTMAFKAEEKGLEVILDTSLVEMPLVVGDAGRIRQIITNLMGNALKFTSEGEVVLRVKTLSQSDSQIAVNIDVLDSGIGISVEKQAALFEAFTQADASTTRQYGGTGLGLSIVKQLCKLMNGKVFVTSEPGKGSCFSVSLMLTASQKAYQALPYVELHKKHILVVDDNTTNRQVFYEQLTEKHMQVTLACSAQEALSVLNKNDHFDAAIIDMQMPLMDGVALCREVKANPQWSHLPLLMMTSQARAGELELMADAGFSGYFSKPVVAQVLYRALAVVLDRGDAQAMANPLITQDYVMALEGDVTEGPMTKPKVNIEESHALENINVLLAEDNPVNQEVACGILEQWGATVTCADNGLIALKRLNESSLERVFDVVLMDCQMPEMDGFAATGAIRQGQAGQRYQALPIIAMTANAMADDKGRCLDAGMNDYVSKPIDPDLLEAALIRQWPKGSGVSGIRADFSHNAHPRPLSNAQSGPVHDTSQPQGVPEAIWDYKGLLRRVGNKPERVKRLARSYTETADGLIAELQAEVDAGVGGSAMMTTIAHHSHAIKGVAGNMGALQVMAVAGQLEALFVSSGDDAKIVADIGPLMAELAQKHLEFDAALRQFLAES